MRCSRSWAGPKSYSACPAARLPARRRATGVRPLQVRGHSQAHTEVPDVHAFPPGRLVGGTSGQHLGIRRGTGTRADCCSTAFPSSWRLSRAMTRSLDRRADEKCVDAVLALPDTDLSKGVKVPVTCMFGDYRGKPGQCDLAPLRGRRYLLIADTDPGTGTPCWRSRGRWRSSIAVSGSACPKAKVATEPPMPSTAPAAGLPRLLLDLANRG